MIVSGSSPSACGVLEVEPLDQRLGGEQRAVARGLLDARALVDLVAQRGHLEPPAGHHLAEVERAAPVHAGVDVELAARQLVRAPARRSRGPRRARPRRRRRASRPARRGRTRSAPSPAWRPTIPAWRITTWSASVDEVADQLEPALASRGGAPARLEAWMSANRIAVSWRAGSSSSAMRANMPWLPRVISDTMLAGAAGR